MGQCSVFRKLHYCTTVDLITKPDKHMCTCEMRLVELISFDNVTLHVCLNFLFPSTRTPCMHNAWLATAMNCQSEIVMLASVA